MSFKYGEKSLEIKPDLDYRVNEHAVKLEEGLYYVQNGHVIARLREIPNAPCTLSAPVVTVEGVGQRWYIAGWIR